MRGRFQGALSLLTATVLSAALGGCAVQHDDALRLSEELGRARADAAWQQARAAALEARLARLEQRVDTAAPRAPSVDDRELLNRLDRLIAENNRLLAERAAPPIPSASAASSTTAPPPASALPARAGTPTPEAQLRALVEQLRGRPGSLHGGLTREQEDALRVLMRPERKLDAENPWPAAFY